MRQALVLLLAISLSSTVTVFAAPLQVRVVDINGGAHSGIVDARSNKNQLWIASEQNRIVLKRSFDWSHVRSIVSTDGKQLDANAILSYISKLPTKKPSYADLQAAPLPRATNTTSTRPALRIPQRYPMVALDFNAYPANWDQDVEWDGIVLWLAPLDQFRDLTVAGGTVTVEFHAAVRKWMRHSTHHGPMHGRLESWTFRIEPTAIGQPIYLPFRRNHPEFNTEIAPTGLLHVRLAAPGRGVFHASRDLLRTRPFSPLRDLRERTGNSRFLQNERNGRR